MKNTQGMQQLEDLFHEASSLEPAERADFMARIRTQIRNWCAVESLIAAHEGSDDLIDSPAYEAAAEMIADAAARACGGQLVGHYQIVAPLGKGGMGEVYLASDTKLDRKVALKLLPADSPITKSSCAVLSRKRRRRHPLITQTSSPSMKLARATARIHRHRIHRGSNTQATHEAGQNEIAEILDMSIQVAAH